MIYIKGIFATYVNQIRIILNIGTVSDCRCTPQKCGIILF